MLSARVLRFIPATGISVRAPIRNGRRVQVYGHVDVHPTCELLGGCRATRSILTIGAESRFARYCHVSARRADVKLAGRNFLAQGVWISGTERIHIGEGSMLGPYSVVVSSNHVRSDDGRWARGAERGAPVSIGDEVWLGAHVVILPGVSIGDGAVIGAGAIIDRNVAAGTTVRGRRD